MRVSKQTALRVRKFAAIALITTLFSFAPANFFDTTAQTLPFSQNWVNTGLITADDNWSGVPGIVGYRGDALTGSTGTDPQTIVADGSATPVDVIANQSSTSIITGGVAEFDVISNPTVALQGSATARAPHIVIYLNTSNHTNIHVSYRLRDIDGSADDAVQPIALQYRIGGAGNYTNVAAAFVSDATTGPSLATLETIVSVVLPSACDNVADLQLRIITSDAVSSDEWVGIDDIAIYGNGCNTTPTVDPVSSQTICHNQSTTAVNFSGTTAPATTYNWANNDASTGLGANGTGNIPSFVATNTGAQALTSTVTVTPQTQSQMWINGSVDAGARVMGSSVNRFGTSSSCGSVMGFPGSFSNSYAYTTYNFTNQTAGSRCVTIKYRANSAGNINLTAYNGTFDPLNLATNFVGLGGSGSSGPTGSWVTFGLDVAAGQTIVLVAHSQIGNCPDFSILISNLTAQTCNGSSIQFNYKVLVTDPVVNNNNDAGSGSLRQAVIDACPGSTITFDAGFFNIPKMIVLTTGEIEINKNLTITGPIANRVTVSGNSISRVFLIRGDVTVNINNLDVIRGNGASLLVGNGYGGGIYNGGAASINNTLTLTNCTFSSNTANTRGGGIYNGGTVANNNVLNVINSTISNNTVTATNAVGAGIYNGDGVLNLTNSTVSANSAIAAPGGLGGGIYSKGTIPTIMANSPIPVGTSEASVTSGSLNMIHSTIFNNSADYGGGIYNDGGTVSSSNSIIAGNTGLTDGPDLFATVISEGYNLVGIIEGSSGWIASDLTGNLALPLDPMLGSLANNGGTTMTHALLSNSPAIDQGSAVVPAITIDQRGSTRPVDLGSIANATGGNASDIGAFELQCISGTWLGTTSSDWFDLANWSCGTVPVATTDVSIPAGTPNSPVIAGNTAQVHNITIQLGAILTNNSTLNLNGGGVIVNNGTYKGSGNFTGANFNNGGGILAPGASPGCTSFAAGYTNDTGTEQIEIGGLTHCSLYDRLQVTGTATLSGTLDVSFYNGYTPGCNESYTIMKSTTLSGTFATVTYPSLPAGSSWDIQYDFPNPGDVTLRIINPVPDVNQPTNQIVCDGQSTTAVTFTGSLPNTVFNWTNDNTSIGLAASGTGNIPSFTATNTTASPVTATVTVTPVLISQLYFSGTLVGAPSQTNRLLLFGNPSFCGSVKATPGTSPGSYPYKTFSFTNTSGSSRCVTIKFRSNNAGVMEVSAYNGSFDPSNILTNYVGDGGTSSSLGTIRSFGLDVANGQTIVLSARQQFNTVSDFEIWVENHENVPCSPGSSKTFTYTVNPKTLVSITGAGTFCGGSTPTLTATAGFSSYSWTRYAFAGVLGINPSLQVSKSGSYGVTATNSFGCTSYEEGVVQIGDFVFNGSTNAASATMANRLFINAITSACAAPKACSVSGAAGPFAYNLHTLTNPNPNPVCATISANIMCTEFMNVSAYLVIFNPANICENYLGDMGHGLFGGTIPFEITIPGGATIVIKIGNTGTGLYCSNYELVVDISRVQPTITTTPDINICSGEQVTMTASQAASYLWSPGGATTQSITVSPSSFTTYTVTLGYGNNGCTTGVQQSIFVSPTPTVAATPMTQTICSGNPITTIQVSSNPANATKDWTRDHTGDVTGMPGNGVGDIMGTLTNTTNAPITVTFTITATAGFNRGLAENVERVCPGQPILVTVIVNPNPDAIASPGTQTICSGNAVINLSGNVPGTVYNWSRDNTGTVTGLPANGTGDINGVLTNTTSNPITVTFTTTPTFTNAGLTCTGPQITATIIVKPMPDVFASVSTQGICNNQSINPIVLTGSFAGTQFSWTRDNTTFVTGMPASGYGSISGALTNNTGVNQQVIFTITPGLNGCSGLPITVTVNVSPTVTGVIQLASNNQLCAGQNGGMIVNLVGRPQFNGAFIIRNLSTNSNDIFIWTSSLFSGQQNILIPASKLSNNTGTPIIYEVTWFSLFDQNGCVGNLMGAANITVYPRPILVVTDPPAGNTCTGGGVNFTVTDLNNIPGVFAVEVRDANNQIVGLGSNLSFGVYHFDAAGCATPGPLTFTFTANGPGPLACQGSPVIRTVSITDNAAPILTGILPGGNNPNTCAENAPAAPTQAAIRALYTDNCTAQAALVITGPVTNLITVGCGWTKTYTYTISDGCGNSATAVVTYTGNDTQAPTWSSSAGSLDRNVDFCDLNGLNTAQALLPSATDNCTAAESITITKTTGVFVPGACPNSGTITNTFIATDLCNNSSAQFTQVITITDNTGPSFIANVPTVQTSTCVLTVANYITGFGISATDCYAVGTTLPIPPAIVYNNNTQGNNMIWQSPAPGTAITTALGSVLVVTIMARDACGNTSTYPINVFVSNITGSIAGTVQVQQNPANSSLITFTGSANGGPVGSQQYLFNYSLSTNNGPFVPQGAVTTVVGLNSLSIVHSHAVLGIYAYRLDAIIDLTTMCTGSVTGNNIATVTVGTTAPLDFTVVMASSPQGLSFGSPGVSKDFIVGVVNINPSLPSTGQIILRLVKSQAFTYTIGAATTTVFGNAVQNSDWMIDMSNQFFVVFTLKPGVVIPGNGSSAIGFTVTRNASAAPLTTHSMTSLIQSGTGGDTNNANNTATMVISAQ